jgi:hypothetical protein
MDSFGIFLCVFFGALFFRLFLGLFLRLFWDFFKIVLGILWAILRICTIVHSKSLLVPHTHLMLSRNQKSRVESGVRNGQDLEVVHEEFSEVSLDLPYIPGFLVRFLHLSNKKNLV